MFTLLLAPLLIATSGSPAATASLEIDPSGLRSSKGLIRVCLTRDPRHFPDCGGDPDAVRRSVAASERRLLFHGLPPGNWAAALFHDENANGKLDMLLGIPREGFGFSRNPAVRFGAPRYDQVSIKLAPGFTRLSVRMQYVL